MIPNKKSSGDRSGLAVAASKAAFTRVVARVYDAAKQSSGIVGGSYYAYIRLPRLFEACQNLRASLSSGPLSQREQQIVNLVVARHWNARYPWFAQVRRSLAVGIGIPSIPVPSDDKIHNLLLSL